MNEEQIDTFLAIVRYGSFSGAVDALYMTQPAVTHRIKTLENELGIQLFFRDNTRAPLTPAGQAFIKEAKALQNTFRRAYSSMVPFAQDNTVRIGFPPLMVAGDCQAFFTIMKFGIKDTRVNVRSVLLDDPSQNARRLTDGEVDLLFSDIDLPKYAGAQFERQPLFRGGLYACMHKGHPLAAQHEIGLHQLKGQTLYRYRDGTLFFKTVRPYLQQAQLVIPPDEYPTMTQALSQLTAESGVLITNVQMFDTPDYRYIPIRCDLSTRIGLVWLKNRCSPATRLLIQHIMHLPPAIWRG